MKEENSKIPSEDTGTMSIHNGPDDRDRISRLGWDGQGASPLWTKSLEKTEDLKRLGQVWDDVLRGDRTMGELFRELNRINV